MQENKIEKFVRLAAVHVVRAFFGVRIIIDGIAICVTFHPTTSQNALSKFIFNLFLNYRNKMKRKTATNITVYLRINSIFRAIYLFI